MANHAWSSNPEKQSHCPLLSLSQIAITPELPHPLRAPAGDLFSLNALRGSLLRTSGNICGSSASPRNKHCSVSASFQPAPPVSASLGLPTNEQLREAAHSPSAWVGGRAKHGIAAMWVPGDSSHGADTCHFLNVMSECLADYDSHGA